MDDFTVDELIELYILLDTRIFEGRSLLNSGELDADSESDIIRSSKTYDLLKRKISRNLDKKFDVRIERNGIVE